MTYSSARGRAPQDYEAHDVNVMEVSSSPQEAALIWELRRLKKFLEEERLREQEQCPRAVDVQRTNRPSRHSRGDGRIPSAKPVDGTVNRLLHRLGLNRRKPAKRSGPRDRAPASARQSARPDPKLPFNPRHGQKPEQTAPSEITAKAASGGQRRADAQYSSKLSLVSLGDRIGIPSPAEQKTQVRSALMGGRGLLRPVRVIKRVRSVYAFLAGRADVKGLDEGSEARLTTRLIRAFESELKTGLRVLIVGVGIVGGWATLVPLSGAVIVPGTLVVESVVKKFSTPRVAWWRIFRFVTECVCAPVNCSCISTRHSRELTLRFLRSSSIRYARDLRA